MEDEQSRQKEEPMRKRMEDADAKAFEGRREKNATLSERRRREVAKAAEVKNRMIEMGSDENWT
jgi:hypothetical protein